MQQPPFSLETYRLANNTVLASPLQDRTDASAQMTAATAGNLVFWLEFVYVHGMKWILKNVSRALKSREAKWASDDYFGWAAPLNPGARAAGRGWGGGVGGTVLYESTQTPEWVNRSVSVRLGRRRRAPQPPKFIYFLLEQHKYLPSARRSSTVNLQAPY